MSKKNELTNLEKEVLRLYVQSEKPLEKTNVAMILNEYVEIIDIIICSLIKKGLIKKN